MGAHKRVHIRKITELDCGARALDAEARSSARRGDVEAMFKEFVPLQLKCLSEYSKLIPGTIDTIAEAEAARLQDRLDHRLHDGDDEDQSRGRREAGLQARLDGVRLGRAGRQAVSLHVPAERDQPRRLAGRVLRQDRRHAPGIEEGLNAGMWTIGLAISGNEIGMPLKAWNKVPKDDQARLRDAAYTRMYQSGAHYVVDAIGDIMPCLDDIEARLGRGERP